MYLSMPSYNQDTFYRSNPMHKSFKTLEEALALVKEAIQSERDDTLFYEYLISIAPTQEEKDIIATIRDDEKKHNQYFREIYNLYTGESVYLSPAANSEKPKSYVEGIKKAKFGELAAVEKYRDIRAGIPHSYFRDMVFEIITDELKHAQKYDYVLYLSIVNTASTAAQAQITPTPAPQSEFTAEQAMQIAKGLGVDFNKERFDLNEFIMGLNTELEHGKKYMPTNLTEDDPLATGKIALAQLREFPDYYTRLAKLEEEAKAYWASQVVLK
jgi:rubrerythrin